MKTLSKKEHQHRHLLQMLVRMALYYRAHAIEYGARGGDVWQGLSRENRGQYRGVLCATKLVAWAYKNER